MTPFYYKTGCKLQWNLLFMEAMRSKDFCHKKLLFIPKDFFRYA